MNGGLSKTQSGSPPAEAGSKSCAEAMDHWQHELEGVLNHAPLGILLVDADFRIAQANPVAQRMLGEIPGLAGRPFNEVMHIIWTKEHADEVVGVFRHTLETGAPFEIADCEHQRRDRNVMEAYEWRLDRIPMRDGRRGVVCYFRDITQRKQRQAALSEAEGRHEQQVRLFDGVASTTPDFVYVFDRQGRFLYANRRLLEVWGMELPEVVGKTCRELGYEQWHHDMHMREIAQVIQSQVQIKGEVPFKAPRTGIYGVYEYIFTPVLGPDGQVEFIAGTTRDVTERKNAEEALRRSQARLAQAVRVAKVGTFEHDHRSDQLDVLPALREIFRFGAEETITLPMLVARIVAEDREAVARAIRKAHDPAGNGLYEMEHRIEVGGTIRWVSVRAQTFFEGDGSQRHPARTIGAMLDITAQKELERGLEDLVAERTTRLQETVGELEHFSYTITHDMRAPLRAMKVFADILLARRAELTSEQQDFISRIAGAAERMDELITDALNYSKVVREQLDLEPVEPEPLLRGISESYPQFQPPRAELEITGPFPIVRANRAGLTQCFSNLLGNAVKFVPPGTVPKIRIRAERREPGQEEGSAGARQRAGDGNRVVRIWFEDNGIGIAPEYHEVIFRMFHRLSKSYEGTGIGLALVRKVVERMRGRVGVESEEGQGSRFWVELEEAT